MEHLYDNEYLICVNCGYSKFYTDTHSLACGEKTDVGKSASSDLLCCPFCGEVPTKYDGDMCFKITHKPDCFLGIQRGAYTMAYIEGKRNIFNWNNRAT